MHIPGPDRVTQLIAVSISLLVIVSGGVGLVGGFNVEHSPAAISDEPPLQTSGFSECVASSSGTAYPSHFTITCQTQGDNSTIKAEMQNGWAYVIFVNIPPDIESENVLGTPGELIFDSVGLGSIVDSIEGAWQSNIDVPSDQLAVVGQSSPEPVRVGPRSTQLRLFSHNPFHINLGVHPGVYQARLVAYELGPPVDGQIMTEGYGPAVSKAITVAPITSSEVTIEVGGCSADFDGRQTLANLDNLKLDALQQLFETKRKFDAEQMDSAETAFKWSFGTVIGEAGPMEDAMATVGLPNIVDFLEQLEKSRDLADQLNYWVNRLKLIQKRQNEVYSELERCYGENYINPPPGYQPLSHDDLIRAKQAGLNAAQEAD